MKVTSVVAKKLGPFSWMQYVLSFFVLGILSVLPVVMFGGFSMILNTGSYAIWFFLYWAAVALVFSLLTAWQKRRAFDHPMRILSEAAKKVAEGDFSIRVKPLNPPKSQTYVDYMFRDFNKMVAELGSLDTMKSDFISNVSHEFKTPLAVIQNYAAELKSEKLSEAEKAEYLDAIITSSKNLSELVSNILRLNKLDNQVIAAVAKPFDLCSQLCECVASFGERLDEKDLDFNAEMEDSVMFQGDAEMLSLVWNNLLSNAIKFTEPGGSITLRQSSTGTAVTVQLSDTGCGMDKETAKHIFDKFYQGDTSHSKEGNGLGLALARRIVEASGGTITVYSAPGEGATFTVTLPQ